MEDYDEPYHFSPACGLEDIIWEGSDAEESPEETQAKRARYEEQAERYNNGQLPILISASLRGPFDRESGWENPWRYRPRHPPKAMKGDEWWKPGSEDMMFTRENVLKRAADHGLGWMTPAAALKWCKAAASAEAGSTIGGEPECTEADVDSGDETLPKENLVDDQLSDNENDQLHRIETHTEPGHSAINTSRASECFREETERPHSSQWLKGKHASKRARWDGTPLPSPTPLPDIRRKIGALKSSGLVTVRTPVYRGVPSSSRLSSQQSQVLQPKKEKAPDRVRRSREQDCDLSGIEVENRGNRLLSARRSSKSPGNRSSDENVVEEPQETISAISFSYGSTIKSVAPGVVSKVVNLLSSDSESNCSKSDSPQERQTKILPISKISRLNLETDCHEAPNNDPTLIDDIGSPKEVSFVTEVAPSCRDLEKFQFRKKKRLYPQSPGSEHGTSSIKNKARSPVVELSHEGNIRKPCLATEREDFEDEWETTIGGTSILNNNEAQYTQDLPNSIKTNTHIGLHQTPSRRAEDFDDDEWETTIGVQDYLSPTKATSTPKAILSLELLHGEKSSPRVSAQVFEETTTPSGSEELDSSWDMMNDTVNNSSFKQIAIASSTKSMTPKSQQHEDGGAVTPKPNLSGNYRVTIKPSKSSTSEQRPPRSIVPTTKSPKSPRLPFSKPVLQVQGAMQQSPLKVTSTNVLRLDESIDQNDLSTQSANTTPTRSLKMTKSAKAVVKSARELQRSMESESMEIEAPLDIVIPDERQPSNNDGQEEGDEIFQTQKPLSPKCTSVSSQDSEASWRHSGIEFEEGNHKLSSTEQDLVQSHQSGLLDDSVFDGSFEVRQEVITSACSSKVRASKSSAMISPHPNIPAPELQDSVAAEAERQALVTPKTRPESSWRASEPQTPWAANEALPSALPSIPTEMVPVGLDSKLFEREQQPTQSDWEQFQRSLAAQNERPKPSEAFVTPVRSPSIDVVNVNHTISPLEDISTINPWTSSLKKTGFKKAKKRVSFGVFLSEGHDSIDLQNPVVALPSRRSSSPQIDFLDDGNSPKKPVMITKPDNGLAASRTFKRILPDKTASQLNSSPAPVEAMAEAFITAEREAPKRRAQHNYANSVIQPSMSNRNSPWGEDANEDTTFSSSTSAQANTLRVDDFITDFDMEGAIGDANSFLEDWSVEGDLKKARELDMRAYESNGLKRRKLFGIV